MAKSDRGISMETYYLIFFFILGSAMGSFYHVVATRLSNNESLVKPGSHCHYCNHKLKWYELIPLISYIIQGGKCRKCHKHIPLSYFLIELITGILFAVCYHVFDFSGELLIALVYISSMIIVIISDIEYMIILDEVLIFASVAITIIYIFFFGINTTLSHLFNAVAAFGLMYLIKIIGDFMFQKESLGGGDIKLMFLSGLVIGLPLSVCTIFLATFIAFPIAIYILLSKKDNMIPFGPFLSMASVIILISKINIQDVIDFLVK